MAAAAEPPCAAEQEREAFLSAYGDMLRDLKAPDKVAINTLSMLAGDNKQHMPGIVNAIMQHIIKCPQPHKLPGLYLVDSIMKNVREPYVTAFAISLPEVFGAVWAASLQAQRNSLQKLCGTWKGILPDAVVAQCNTRMAADRNNHATAAGRAAQQQQQQQQRMPAQPLGSHLAAQQQLTLQPLQQQQPALQMQYLQPVLQQQQQFVPQHQVLGGLPVMQLGRPPQQQQQVVYMQINGQLVPVGTHPQQQPTLMAAPLPPMHPQAMQAATPQHIMQVSGLPPVSPAHPGWAAQQQAPQHQWPPLGGGPSPAAAHASPMHLGSGSSPQQQRARGSSQRSASPAHAHASAALGSLLDNLVKSGAEAARAAEGQAIKTVTSFSPAFLKEFHASVLQQLEEASERTRPKFRDVEFQRAKRRTAAASAGSSRGWYLEVDTWVAGTTAGTADAAEGSGSDAQGGEAGEEQPPPVEPEDPLQPECAISGEPFDKFFDDVADGWFYRGVARISGNTAARYGVPDGALVKVKCLSEAGLGSGAAAMAAAAAGGGGGDAAAAADMAAAAAAAPAAGEAAGGGGGGGAAAPPDAMQEDDGSMQQQQHDVKPALASGVKLEPGLAEEQQQQHFMAVDGIKCEDNKAAAVGAKREAEAAAASVPEGSPSKRQRM